MTSKLNCEVLHDDLAFEVRWAVAGDSIVLQLVAKLDNREYMSFGISGDSERSQMVDGDVVVAWVDKETLKGYAEDYFLEAKAQCSGPQGSCPDARLAENTNNIRLLNAAMVNGYSIVTYQRPLRPSDVYDKPILTNQSQAIIWALGPLNQRDEVSFHTLYTKQDKLIDFGRAAKWNCPMPEGDQPPMKSVTMRPVAQAAAYTAEEPTTPPQATSTRTRGRNVGRGTIRQQTATQPDSERSATRQRNSERRGTGRTTTRVPATPVPVSTRNAWVIPPIQCNEPDDGVFYAQMGPTGGKHGYPAITGHVGWGISWYINGLLIPEINVVRGKTYNFVTEGGDNPEVPARYHPFYITDDPIGGYDHKTTDERNNVTIFAGVREMKDGSVEPTGVGRLCYWTPQADAEADDYDSFGAYQRVLQLKCDVGEPGFIQWTPDKNTPDTVYYQCFSHRYLGWKINVLDSCDIEGAGSEIVQSVALPDPVSDLVSEGDLDSSPSLQIETRVRPNNIEDVLNKDEPVVSIPEDIIVTTESTAPLDTRGYMQELPMLDTKYVFQPDVHNITVIQLPIPPKLPFGSYTKPMKNLVLRRPPPQYIASSMMRPQYVQKPMMKLRRPTMYMKKPYYRPMLKMPMGRPLMKFAKPILLPVQGRIPMHALPSNIILMKAPLSPHLIARLPEPIKLASEPQVEVSKVQEATDRQQDLNAFTEKPLKVPIRIAVNTGFDPSSVVIESGFIPIIAKQVDADRRAGQVEEADEEDTDVGVIDESVKLPNEQATEFFEPMFIPSPTIDVKKPSKKKSYGLSKPHHAGRRSSDQRPDSFYLPPDNKRVRAKSDMPPSTVITFDGRKVSGASLTPRHSVLNDRSTMFEGTVRSPKTDELLRQPQSVPFRGELPPLQSHINYDAPQLQSVKQVTIRQLQEFVEEPPQRRGKREAHHTEEHTAQQERERSANSSLRVQLSLSTLLASLVLQMLH